MIRIKLYYLLLFIIINFFAKSQVFDFKLFNQENGIPSSVITSIIQDSRHIIWIGTDGAGLVKFDGNTFYTYDQNEGLEGTFITDIAEDQNGNLIIATKFNGIAVFNGSQFFKTITQANSSIKSSSFYKFKNTTKGVYAVSDKEIILIDKSYQITQVARNNNDYGVVNSIEIDNELHLLIGTENGLFTVTKNKIEKVYPELLRGYICLNRTASNRIILATQSGAIYKTGPSINNSLTKIFNAPFLPTFSVKHVFQENNGDIWFGGDGKQGLIYFDGKEFTFINKTNGFNGENISCFLQDKANNFYIGTFGTGLYKTGKQLFYSYTNSLELSNPLTFCVFYDNINLYTGNRKEGISKFHATKNGSYQFEKKINEDCSPNTIIKNKDNVIVVGHSKGLGIINDNTWKDIKIGNFENDKINIVVLKQDRNSRYFIGTHGNGLLITDQKFNTIGNIEKVRNILDNYISTIDQASDNSWYIGTNHGLYLLTEIAENRFDVSGKIIDDVISISTQDEFGTFWFTGNNCIYSYKNKQTKKFDKSNGLTSTLIYTLIADKNANLWLGSNLGIDKVEVNKKGDILFVRNYNSKNGFTSLETNMRSQFIDTNGDIYLGTVKGLVKCVTGNKLEKPITAQIQINNIRVLNQQIDWKSGQGKWFNLPQENYEFDSNQNQLTFQFSILNNNFNHDFMYSYKLEGNDKAWSNPTYLNEVTYSNLTHGKYTFKVRLVDKSGNAINQETCYSFIIKTPFYYSWWFIAIVMGLIATIFTFLSKKNSSYNKDFVKEDDESFYNIEEIRIYLLFFGIVIPLVEVFIELFHVRSQSELIPNFSLGIACILLYFVSKKNKFVYENTYAILISAFILYTIFLMYKTLFFPFELVTFCEFSIVLFFSHSLFKFQKQYWIFIFFTSLFLVSLFFISVLSTKIILVYFIVVIFIVLINHTKHIASLNSKEKLLFSNNIVNNGSSLVLATTKYGEVSFCSKNIYKILGYTVEEVMGMKFWELTEDKDFQRINYDLRYNKDKIYVRKLKCKNGEYKFIQWTDQKYSTDLYVGIGQDVTEQINAQEQYRNLVQSATDIIYESDHRGNFTFINQFAEKTLGYKLSELLGTHFTALIKKEYVLQVSRYYQNIDVNTDTTFDVIEFPIIKKNGEEIWVSQKVNITRAENGKISGYSAIVRDITALKHIELEKARRQEKTIKYNEIIKNLTIAPYSETQNLVDIFKNISEQAATGILVDRISIWEYFEDRAESLNVYEIATNIHSNNVVIWQKDYPIYFNALKTGNLIVAPNVCEYESTKEFCNDPEDDLKSLLDIPIFFRGNLQGLICFESITEFRKWDAEDVNFARSISDIISVSMESQKRKEAEQELAYRSQILAAVAKSTEKFVLTNNIVETLNESIYLIGHSLNVGSLNFYQFNYEKQTADRVLGWKSEDLNANTNEIANIPINELEYLISNIKNNDAFASYTINLPISQVKELLLSRGIVSLMVLPILIKNSLYGFISFHDYVSQRTWTNDEITILQSFVTNVANAIERIDNEQTIKESEHTFRSINETIDDVFWLCDIKKNKVEYISPSCEKILGVTQTKFYTENNYWTNYILEEDKPSILKAHQALLIEGYYEVEYRIKFNDEIRWIFEKSFAIKNEAGELIKNSGICSNITEKKIIQKELKQLSLVAEKTTNGILIADKDGYALWANQGYLEMFEISLKQLINKRPRDLFNPNDFKLSEEIDTVNGTNYKREFEITTLTNKIKWVELNNTVILDLKGNPIQQIEVLTDITQKHLKEIELEENKKILELYSNELVFQNTLKEKLINASTFEEITIEALGFIKVNIKNCLHIAMYTLDEKTQNLNGYYLSNGEIKKERFVKNDIKSFNTVKDGRVFIEPDLVNSINKSTSDYYAIDNGVKSYVVLPIINSKELIGTLNIGFDTLFDLSSNEIENFKNFTSLLSVALKQLSLKKLLIEKNKDNIDSLNYAQNIQNTILPNFEQMTNSLKNVSLVFKPRDIVSGDFYWAKELGDYTFIAVADCTGHGVPGAFLTLIGSRILEQIIEIEKNISPADILMKLDEQIYLSLNSKQSELIRDGMEIALCIINKKSNTLYFSGAGMGLLYFIDDTEYYIKGQRKSIGDYRNDGFHFENVEIQLTGKEKFYMATDGYQDQLGGSNYKRFSKKKLIDILSQIKDFEPEQQKQILNKELENYIGNYHQTDDITILGFSVK